LLERGTLENEVLRMQIRRNAQQVGPPMPIGGRYLIDGQGSTSVVSPGSRSLPSVPGVLVQDNPLRRTAAAPEGGYSEAGAITDVGHSRTASGGYAVMPSRDAQERMEDNIIAQIYWALRNQVLPEFAGGAFSPPPGAPLPEGMVWQYHPLSGEYRARPPISLPVWPYGRRNVR